MGYTHYFYTSNDLSPEQWAKIRTDTEALIADAPCALAFEYDDSRPPLVTNEEIRFNGVDDEGHETFYFTRKRQSPRPWAAIFDDHGEHFAFCKTNHKPYDIVVCAVLAVIAERAPDKVRVISDGGPGGYAAALKWASEVLRRRVVFPGKTEPQKE